MSVITFLQFTAIRKLHLLFLVPFIIASTTGCSALFGTSDADEETTRPAAEVETDPDFQPYTQDIPGTEVTMDMVPVQGGTFAMGRAADEDGKEPHEGPQRDVHVDSFWMSAHEITWDQYDLFAREVVDQEIAQEYMERFEIPPDAITTPSAPYGDETFGMGRDGRPAVSMTHYAAVIYAMWMTGKTGEFHRLPTEAEWEYACRGGVYGNYELKSDESALDNHEWYGANSDNSYQRVASKEPNPLGLYDMKGNVAEWTMDEFHEDYHDRLEGEVAENPWFKPEVLYPRAVRGGTFRQPAEDIRCTQRRGSEGRWSRGDPQIPRSVWWHTNASFVGFRLVRPKETPSKEEIEEYWIKPILDI